MGSIDRYIFRTTLASFALVLVSLTGVIWITQALRGIDLMTSQGQTILTFLGFTSLVIPALVLIIAPIALMIAISHTLNKLATDSEIIVMNAAGFSPFRLFRPFFYATCVVALMVAFIAAYLAPDGMRRLKRWDAEITADVLANILQPGRFTQLDQNLTIRIRERQVIQEMTLEAVLSIIEGVNPRALEMQLRRYLNSTPKPGLAKVASR